jgi:hypothetical protein
MYICNIEMRLKLRIKVEFKVHPRTGYEGPESEKRHIYTFYYIFHTVHCHIL